MNAQKILMAVVTTVSTEMELSPAFVQFTIG